MKYRVLNNEKFPVYYSSPVMEDRWLKTKQESKNKTKIDIRKTVFNDMDWTGLKWSLIGSLLSFTAICVEFFITDFCVLQWNL